MSLLKKQNKKNQAEILFSPQLSLFWHGNIFNFFVVLQIEIDSLCTHSQESLKQRLPQSQLSRSFPLSLLSAFILFVIQLYLFVFTYITFILCDFIYQIFLYSAILFIFFLLSAFSFQFTYDSVLFPFQLFTFYSIFLSL